MTSRQHPREARNPAPVQFCPSEEAPDIAILEWKPGEFPPSLALSRWPLSEPARKAVLRETALSAAHAGDAAEQHPAAA